MPKPINFLASTPINGDSSAALLSGGQLVRLLRGALQTESKMGGLTGPGGFRLPAHEWHDGREHVQISRDPRLTCSTRAARSEPISVWRSAKARHHQQRPHRRLVRRLAASVPETSTPKSISSNTIVRIWPRLSRLSIRGGGMSSPSMAIGDFSAYVGVGAITRSIVAVSVQFPALARFVFIPRSPFHGISHYGDEYKMMA